jgi:hypothetical protein
MYSIYTLNLKPITQNVLEHNGIIFVFQIEALGSIGLRHLKFITNGQIKEIQEKLEAFNKET